MNIAQLSEQLKDVPQNTLIGYAKNPNSVVPQFLALAEIQRRQHLQAQTPAPSGTVADDVLAQAAPQPAPQIDPRLLQAQAMQQAQQLPENQPGVAQLPTGMPQGMASGGIVAFAGGGSALDDEDEDVEMARLFPQQSSSRFEEILAALPAVAGGIRSLADKSAEKYKNVMSAAPSSFALPKSFGEARQDISSAATGAVDGVEDFLSKIKHLESRGRAFDSKGNILTSPKGAQGSMQVMPKTQLNPGFGVTPARNKSPEELERVGRDYGIAMLNEFKDPKLAAMAYNWGPANVKKWLASDRAMPIPKETRKYAAHFADGGDVEEDNLGPIDRAIWEAIKNPGRTLGKAKDYITGLGTTYYGANEQPYVNASPADVRAAMTGKYKAGSPAVQGIASLPTERVAALTPEQEAQRQIALSGVNRAANKEGLFTKPSLPLEEVVVPSGPMGPYDDELNRYAAATAPEAPKSKADLYAEALEKSLASQEAEAAQNKKLQLGLSLLGASAAGLQSGSPYFSQGVGAALSGGVNTYGALKKQEQDAAKDMMATRLGMYKYGAAAENAAELRAQNKLIKDIAMEQRKVEANQKEYNNNLMRLQTYDTSLKNQVLLPYKNNEMYKLNPDKFEAEIQAKLAAARQSDPVYKELMRKLDIPLPQAIPTSVIVQTPKGPVSFPNQEAADQFKKKAGIK